MTFSPSIRFWILVILGIPAVLCSLLLLGYLCFDRTLRQGLHNHVIILLLLALLSSQLVDVRNFATYLQIEYVWPATPVNCYAWHFVTYGVYNSICIFMAWAAIERHILVFHHRWTLTLPKRLIVHYLPLTLIVMHIFIFYGSVLFLVPCEQVLQYSRVVCGRPCYLSVSNITWYDFIFNSFAPTMIVLFGNIALIARVVRQKQQLRQKVHWHKYQRMVIQSVSCSVLFLCFHLPPMSLTFAQYLGLPFGALGELESYIWFMGYFPIVLLPFVCLGSSKEVCITIMQTIKRTTHNFNDVAPATTRALRQK